MPSAGTVYAKVSLDDRDAVATLNKLRDKIAKLQDELNRQRGERDSLARRIETVSIATEKARQKVERLQAALAANPKDAGLKARLREENASLKDDERILASLQKDYDNINAKIAKGESELNATTAQAAELEKQIAAGSGAMAKLGRASDAVHKKMKQTQAAFGRLIKRIVVYSLFREMFRNIRQYFADYAKVMPEVSDAVSRLKGSFKSLAYPIVNGVTPALVNLLNIVNRVVQVLAQAMAQLFGMTAQQAQDGAEALQNETDALNATGGAAKKAAKQMANFDEINQLTDNSGGGSGKKNTDIAPTFDLGEPLDPGYLDYVLKMVTLIGAALLAWKINPVFGQGFLKTFAGIFLVVDGVVRGVKAIKDVLENGWDTHNLMQVITAIMEIGAGIALIVGGPIPLLIAAIASVLLAITVLTGHGEELIEGFKEILSGFVDFFKGVFAGDIDLAVQGIEKIFEGLKKVIFSIFDSFKDLGIKFLNWFDKVTHGVFHGTIEDMKKMWSDGWENIKAVIGNVIDTVKEILHGLTEFIMGILTGDMERAGKGIANVFIGILNFFIKLIESIVNLAISAINSMLSLVNSFLLDNFVTEAIGKLFGVEPPHIQMIDRVTFPRIPQLAQGAVIPPNREFLAMLGDQKSGTNIEAPLDTIVAAFRQALSEQSGGKQTIVLECNKRQFAQLVLDMNNLNSQRIGARLGG